MALAAHKAQTITGSMPGRLSDAAPDRKLNWNFALRKPPASAPVNGAGLARRAKRRWTSAVTTVVR